MRSANIPNILFPEKSAPQTLTAATPAPVSPFSGKRMIEATLPSGPVFVDQVSRIVVPVRKDGY